MVEAVVEKVPTTDQSHGYKDQWTLLDRILGFWMGLVFVVRLALDYYTNYELSVEQIGKFKAQIFRPSGLFGGKSRGMILVIPGLSPSGYEDERVKQLGMAIAGCGFTAAIPCLERYSKIEITMAQVDDMIEFSEAMLKERPELCPGGRISVTAACISAGFAMVASTRFHITSLLSIGGYASAAHVAQLHMRDEQEDDYGRNAMFFNFFREYEGENKVLEEIFYARLIDNHLETNHIESHEYEKVKAQYPEEAKLYERVQSDSAFRAEVVDKIWGKVSDQMHALSPIVHVPNVSCDLVALVHGLDDNVVPHTESETVFKGLKMSGKPALICTTPLLNHANKSVPGPKMMREAFDLVEAFGAFFLVATGRFEGPKKEN